MTLPALKKVTCSHPRAGVRPAIHPAMQRFLDDKALVFSLVDGIGSPLNVLFPQHIAANVQKFEDVYKERHLRGRIFYTSKPNKSMALKKRAALTSAGLDVSSEGELKAGLSAGFHPSRIEATGPKNKDYLTLCVQQDALVNADNFTELNQLIALHGLLPSARRIRILVRLEGFGGGEDGAFGIRVSEASALLDFLVQHKDRLDFQGFSFHFNAGDTTRRPAAIAECLKLTFAARERGLAPRVLDIGGGYRIRYAATREEWDVYIETLKDSVRTGNPSLTWNDSGLGFHAANGIVQGVPNFMDHYPELAGADALAAILDTPLPEFNNQTAAGILSESLLELYVEPGRALLDQCGLTLAKVNFTKPSVKGETLVMLDMNRTNINAVQLKLMTDPVILCREGNRRAADGGVYYVGNLCLTHDMIQYHKTFPPALPESGDAIAFINTAAYQMDFAETPVLQQRIAEKIAVEVEEGGIHWSRDELYSPVSRKLP